MIMKTYLIPEFQSRMVPKKEKYILKRERGNRAKELVSSNATTKTYLIQPESRSEWFLKKKKNI